MKGTRKGQQLLPTLLHQKKPQLTVIIPVLNEEKRIAAVINQSKQIHPNTEILVIANGCSDRSVAIARKMGARVIEFQSALGHDVGRAIGAYHARGTILLFLDADMVIPAEQLQPFIRKIRSGLDIALNSYPKLLKRFPPHPTVTAKHALNIILNRNDLRAASLTSVPFAMRKTAAKIIGYSNLSVPPLAQAIAIEEGLRVGIGGYVNVGKLNPVRKRKRSHNNRNPICDLILGDHIEAISYLIQKRGIRGGFHDLNRLRDKIEDIHIQQKKSQSNGRESVHLEQPLNFEIQSDDFVSVIPTCNESSTIESAIQTAGKSGVNRVLVIDNGSNDGTAKLAKKRGAEVFQYPERLGHDIGRAVGAIVCSTSHLLFTDGDIPIKASDLSPFVRSIQNGTDVALNDLNILLPHQKQFDAVSIIKRFLNLVMNQPELGICSLTAVPHALSNRAIREIGAHNLAVPPLAHVIALHKKLNVQAVHGVDVIKSNKLRPSLHVKQGKPLQRLIIGDHIEAIAYILSMIGPRAYFPDTLRKRNLVQEYLHSKIATKL